MAMPAPVLNCVICGKPVALADAKTDADGKALHEECSLPQRVTISPIALVCPRCGAWPGHVCELFEGEVEIVHVERIKKAAAMDTAATKARGAES
jgi:hypothetical protein